MSRWFISALAIGLPGLGLTVAQGADLRCDSPGIAQKIVPFMFAESASAKKLGLEAAKVKFLSLDGDACLVEITTIHGQSLKYRFRLSANGEAALEIVP